VLSLRSIVAQNTPLQFAHDGGVITKNMNDKQEDRTNRFQMVLTNVMCQGFLAFDIAILIAYATHAEITDTERKAIFWAALALPALAFALALNAFHKLGEMNGSFGQIASLVLRLFGLIFSCVAIVYFFHAFSSTIGWAFAISTGVSFFVFLHSFQRDKPAKL
jgi:cytochrome bd-type quinol oxidase subunit 2